MTYFSTHNHSSYSNAKVGLDSINRIDEMIKYANDIKLAGIVLSDHEILSGHIDFIKEYQRLKENGVLNEGFKIGLGNEIYYCMEEDLEELKENRANKNEDSQFFHFLLIALNSNGHYQLRQLSSIAWENSWRDGLVERTPTFKKDLKRIIKKGDVVASSACLGGRIPQLLLKMKESKRAQDTEDFNRYKSQLDRFIDDCIDIFGKEYFYLEIQPSNNEEQIYVNKELIKLSRKTGLKYTVATDGHYLKKEDRANHKYYLLAQNISREVDAFYDATYVMSEEEVKEYLDYYLTEDEIQAAFDATMEIYDKIEFYDLYQKTIIPHPQITPDFELQHVLKPVYDQYDYIKKFAYSDYIEDRYYLSLVQKGLIEKIVQGRKADKEYFHKCLNRVNIEFRELWLISERLEDRMSAYYGLTEEVVETIWNEGDSIVGVARGSAAGYFTNFLSGIVQISALDYDLPHFRHLTAERVELPDVDLDTEKGKRGKILQALIDKYSRRKVLNIATFTTEGTRSALLTAARGMQIEVSEVSYLTSLIPSERGFLWNLSDCFLGNEKLGRKPVAELVNAVSKYEGLMETAMKIEGLVKSRSVHASGLYIFNDDYTTQNAMMKSSSGQQTTQFDMKSSDHQGGLKLDLLTTEASDKIRTAMDLLVENNYIDKKETLRKTYDAYLHPDVLVYEDKEMWDKVGNIEIPELFQFETPIGGQCVKKSKPQNIEELSAANSLMRLMSEDDEQPIDKFVRHKEDIQNWYDEMKGYDLLEDEVETLKEHLGKVFGVSSSQEEMMLLLMDQQICGFSVAEANFARSVVGKKKMDKIPEVKDMIFTMGAASENMRKYLWDTQIATQMGYSFSTLHSTAYSLIALQEMNLAHLYPRVFWDVACLTVSAGADEDSDSNKSSNYGKIASGIGKMRQYGVKVTPPLINQASFGFAPDAEKNQIVFGLKGINSLNDDLIHTLIANRPYASFGDFHTRMYETKLVTRGQALQLIKAGCFNEFDSQIEIMKQFLVKEVDVKTSLNGQNMQRAINLGLFNTPEYQQYQDYYNFRKYLTKKVHEHLTNPKSRVFILEKDDDIELFYRLFDGVEPYGYHGNGLLIEEKAFTKDYDAKMLPVKELLTDVEFVRSYNNAQFFEKWHEFASGTVESWQMESVSFFADKHQLDYADQGRYGIVDFNSLSEIPVVLSENTAKNGRVYKNLELSTIAGVVLDKNKNSKSFVLLTSTGIVNCRTHAGGFSHYDRQIKFNGHTEKGYFTRGTLLLVQGFRRNDTFVLKSGRGSHTINKINEIRTDGSLSLQTDRMRTD